MAVIVNGREYRTLDDVFYVKGNRVTEAYVNGVKVYPEIERDKKYKYWVEGHVFTFRQSRRTTSTWILPDWWNAEAQIDITFRIESVLPILHIQGTMYELDPSSARYYENQRSQRTTDTVYDLISLGLQDNKSPSNYHGFNQHPIRYKCWGNASAANYGSYQSGLWGANSNAEWSYRSCDIRDYVETTFNSDGQSYGSMMYSGMTVGDGYNDVYVTTHDRTVYHDVACLGLSAPVSTGDSAGLLPDRSVSSPPYEYRVGFTRTFDRFRSWGSDGWGGEFGIWDHFVSVSQITCSDHYDSFQDWGNAWYSEYMRYYNI